MFRRGLAYFVLVFSLLFAQQGGFAHELGHVSGKSQQSEKQLPHSKVCDECGAYSQVGSGAVSQAIPFVLPEFSGAVYSFRDVAQSARHFSSHNSRAPPFLA
jgi:hypothetical protein